MRAISCVFFVALLLPLSAGAQVSEQDRQARCANNQARIDELQGQLKDDPDYLPEDEIARRRAGLKSARETAARADAQRAASPPRQDFESTPGKAKYIEMMKTLSNIAQSLDPGAGCDMSAVSADMPEMTVYGQVRLCATRLENGLGSRIQRAVEAGRRTAGIREQIAQHRAHKQSLMCNAAPPPPASCQEAVVGNWSWAFAPPGQTPAGNGSVEFKPDGHMCWSGGSHGRWTCSGASVSLQWEDNPSSDTMSLSADGRAMAGTNDKGWNVKGTR